MESFIIDIPVSELAEADSFFKRHTGVETDNVPEKYGSAVTDAKKIILDNLSLKAVCCEVEVGEKGDKYVLINGEKLTGEIPPMILKNSERAFCFVSSLAGFDDAKNGVKDIMENYFLDSWATAFVENSQSYIKKYLSAELEEGFKLTHIWSPGQHSFDLVNQRPLFKILKPEVIGVTLSTSCRMNPVKTVSGILGVIKSDDTYDFLPCSFCYMAKSCPASKIGCGNY